MLEDPNAGRPAHSCLLLLVHGEDQRHAHCAKIVDLKFLEQIATTIGATFDNFRMPGIVRINVDSLYRQTLREGTSTPWC